MSLINQALKKAQRDRSPRTPGASAPPGETGDADRPGPARPRPWLLLALAGAGLAGLIGASGGWVVYALTHANDTAPSSPSPSTANAPTPSGKPPDATPDAAARPTSAASGPAESAPRQNANAPDTPPDDTAPEGAPDTKNPEAILGALRAANEAAQAKARQSGERQGADKTNRAADAAPSAAEASRDEPSRAGSGGASAPRDKIIAWLRRARITGVRAGADGKMILNERVYTLGETVNYALELKLVAIRPNKAFFEDADGTRYLKRF